MQILNTLKQNWLIIFILIIGFAFRFIPLYDYEFSHDELSGLSRTFYNSFFEEINKGIKIDAHPALIQLFLWYWVKLFGMNEIAIKLPFLICGVLSIWYIYCFCKLFFNKNAGFIAASILACSFIFLVYSSYARMYITGVLFSILFLISVFKILFIESTSLKNYFLFTLFALLCAYNHHMSALFAFTVVFFSFFFIQKSQLKTYLVFCSITILLYLPHLPITLYQLSIGGIGAQTGGWLPPPRNNELFYFIKTLFGCGLSGIIISLLLLLLMIILFIKRKLLSKQQTFLFLIFIINYTIIHLYSVFKNPILQNSCLLFCGISLILCVSSFFETMATKQVTWLSICLIGLFCYENINEKHIFTKVHVNKFEQEVKTYLAIEKKFGKQAVTGLFASEDVFVSIYEKKYATNLNYKSTYNEEFQTPEKFKQYISSLQQSFIVLGDISPMKIEMIKKYFPYIYSQKESYFSNILVLSKIKTNNIDNAILHNKLILNSNLTLICNPNKKLIFNNSNVNFQINKQDDEFPFNVKLPIQNSDLNQYQFLVVELSYTCDSINNLANDKFCLSIGEPDKTSVFYTDTKLIDGFDSSKKSHKVYLELFLGSEFDNWNKKNVYINLFIWKTLNSHYSISNFKLNLMNYNPSKWELWN